MASAPSDLRRSDDLALGVDGAAAALSDDLAVLPIDHYVIWVGQDYCGRPGSRCSRVLPLVREAWTPVSLRELAFRAAQTETSGLGPDVIRDALRQHQRALGASYLLVRKSAAGDYLAVTDIPSPAHRPGAIRAGQIVFTRTGARFEDAG